jgi:sugar phosphate permease
MDTIAIKNFTLKRYIHVLLPLFIGSIIAYLDRVNIAYAALTMNQDLQFTPKFLGWVPVSFL